MPDALPLDLTLACSRFSRFAARRADVGVSSVTWRVAATLAEHDELRVSDIAALENVTRPTATAVVQRLEEEGLVRRRSDPSDSRSSLVRLTELGAERLDAWRDQLRGVVAPLLTGLTAADRAALERAVVILERAIDAGDAPAASASTAH